MATETTERTLAENVASLHAMRTSLAKAKAVMDEARKEWEEQWAPESMGLKAAQKLLADLEAMIRSDALTAFQRTGDRHPAAGVEIKDFKTLTYDSTVAYEWAIEHRMALKLDAAAFEAIAKVQFIPYVTAGTEPRAQIASDLGKLQEE